MESFPNPTNQPELPVLQTVLHVDFQKCEPIVEWLKKNTHNYLIGQHPADEDTQTTHCHILLQGLKVTREALRKEVIKYAPGRGQNFTSAQCHKQKVPYEVNKLAIYIIKGDREQVMSTSFDPFQIIEWEQKWVFHESPESPESPMSPVPTPKKKPNTKWQDCQEIIETYLKDEDWYRIKQIPYVSPTLEARTRIPGYIVAWANSKQKAMNSYLVADYYDIILSSALPELYANQCAAIINNRHRFSH